MRDDLAMAAPDRARLDAALEFCPDALAHRLVAGVGELRLALLADQITHTRSGCERTRPVDSVAGIVFPLGRADRESIVDIDPMCVGEVERARRHARLPYHVTDEGC